VLLHPALRDDQPPRVPDVAQHIDIAPTLLDVLGIEPPADWQGRSLLRREETANDLSRGGRAYFIATGNQVVLGLRDGPYKYHYYLSSGHEELFDLTGDAAEMHNLAALRPDRCAGYKRKLGGLVSHQRRFLARHSAK
jgi:arylsulfatase A-like enzyme